MFCRQDLKNTLAQELDFEHEGHNGERCARELRSLGYIRVPSVFWHNTSKVPCTFCFMYIHCKLVITRSWGSSDQSALYRNEAGSHSIAREGVFCFMYMHGTCPSILMQLVERREISTGKSWLVNVLLLQLHHDHLVTTFELSHILTNTLNNVFLLSI